MTIDLLDRSGSSEALADLWWCSRRTQPSAPRGPASFTDITSTAWCETIRFGQHALIFEQAIPRWSYDLLMKVSEIGELEQGWDSYGARAVDPDCAATTVELVLNLLDSNTPMPAIVPTIRGGIQLEWHRAGADLEIEVESRARIHVCFEDEQTGEEREFTLSDNLLPLLPLLGRVTQAH